MIREFNLNGKSGKISLETEADLSVFEEIFVDRDYKVIDAQIKNAKVIFDIGAHIGCFFVYAGVLNSNAKIFGFEPDERNFSLLKENLKVNRVEGVMKNVAIGGFTGDRKFFLSSDSHNHSLLGSGESVKVFVRSLDDVLDKFDHVDLVKMDIEGAEFEIFDEINGDFLKKVGSFYIEYHEGEGRNADKIMEVLKRGGFKVSKKASFYEKSMGFILGVR